MPRLCGQPPLQCASTLSALKALWIDNAPLTDGKTVSQYDEAFHMQLLAAAGNQDMARIHAELTEKIRIIHRLDFTRDEWVAATYREHAQILRAIFRQHGGGRDC